MKRRTTKFDTREPTIPLVAKNDNQQLLINSLRGSEQVIVLGPAGTGKTYISATYAAQLYQAKKISKIILTRPNVAAGRSIGFFPGSLEEKMAPWMAPIIDVLTKHLSKGVVETAIKNGNIEITPFETMRGRSFEDAFVLLDEAQNTTVHEMQMFLTRVGEGSQVVLNGDIMQSDLKETSGLKKVIHMAKKHNLPIPVVEFTVDDIVRSDLCKLWIETFIKEGIA